MRISSEDFLEQPADRVYPLVRDQMTTLLPYLPDVESIVVVSYARESETRVRIVNQWKARAQIPATAQKFLPPDIASWTDKALWKDDEYCVDYTLEGYGYLVKGTNGFKPHNGGTKLTVDCDLTIFPEKFKIPRFVFERVFPVVEGYVSRAVQPNLTALARGLKRYFAEN